MPAFVLDEIMAALTDGQLVEKGQEQFADIVTDTRKIIPGVLFVALKGEKFNGETFAVEAIKLGANGVIVSNDYNTTNLGGTVIKVADTQKAYQEIAGFWRQKHDIPVIAITGSNGKTTTKDLTAAVLSAKFPVLKTQANFNNEIGLPLTLLQLTEVHRAAVVEIGMRGLGQIAALAPFANPSIGIVTNVGETHIELLGSLDNIAKAKSELVEAIAPGGTVILNNDNPYTAAMKDKAATGVQVITFGIDQEADIRGSQLISNDNSTTFHCQFGKGGPVCKMTIPMLGSHNVSNALAAIATGWSLGLTPQEIASGLGDLQMTGMRFECSRKGQYNIINDAYNASPMSMAAALNTLSEVTVDKRAVAVLGDMLELGEVSSTAHREVGHKVAETGVAVLVTLGEMGQEIAAGAREAGLDAVYTATTHNEVADILKKVLKPEDTVLFKGSRGMQMEKIIDLL